MPNERFTAEYNRLIAENGGDRGLALADAVVGEIKGLDASYERRLAVLEGKLSDRLSRLETMRRVPVQTTDKNSEIQLLGDFIPRYHAEELKAIATVGRGTLNIPRSPWHVLPDTEYKGLLNSPESKASITSSTVGVTVPGVIQSDRISDITPLARRPLRLRDLLPSVATQSGIVDYIRQSAFSGGASPVAEGGSKNESTLTFTDVSTKPVTLAHWTSASRSVLSDWKELAAVVNDEMLYRLALIEEAQLLSGDGLLQHITGLIPSASTYQGTFNAVGDNRLDTLRNAIAELTLADETPDFVVLSPADTRKIDLIKDQAGNVGNYVASSPLSRQPLSVKTIWGLVAVESNSMSPSTFLIGDSSKCKIVDRMGAVVEFSDSHASYFTQNMVAIRAEERVGLAIFRTTAFLQGVFVG